MLLFKTQAGTLAPTKRPMLIPNDELAFCAQKAKSF